MIPTTRAVAEGKGHYESKGRDFSGGPVVKTLHFQCRGPGSIPGQGTRSCMLQLRSCMQQLRPGVDR